MPKKKSRKSRAMEGVNGEGAHQLEVQETRQEQDTQPPTTPNMKTLHRGQT